MQNMTLLGEIWGNLLNNRFSQFSFFTTAKKLVHLLKRTFDFLKNSYLKIDELFNFIFIILKSIYMILKTLPFLNLCLFNNDSFNFQMKFDILNNKDLT